LAWRIEFDPRAEKELGALDRQIAKRIKNYLDEVADLPNPRVRGKPLKGTFAGYWRYRIGDYRAICAIRNECLVVLVIKIGHRKETYR
jgi:mRNA interferase RelE/StbE